jgi:hypothetical protein
MDQTESKISLGEKMEIIQLNGSLTNFHSEFKIVSEDNAPFSAVVINHKSLDEMGEENVEFKSAPKGIFSGEITEASDEYDNWYIAVKAPKQTNALLTIDTVEISPLKNEEEAREEASQKKGLSPLTIVIIVAVLLVLGFIVYKFFFSGGSSGAAIYSAPAPVLTAAPPSAPEPSFSVEDIDLSDLPPI